MTRRSRAREIALQLLYQRDHNPGVYRARLEDFVRQPLGMPEPDPFCLSSSDGVVGCVPESGRQLGESAANWRLPRMATVDRNVLRLGAYELLFAPDTPGRVAIDEAIELARRFGSAESPAFVNGILDRLYNAA